MPVTISGVTSERYSDPVSTRDPRFHKPYADKVPMMVESTVAHSAITTLFHRPSISCGSLKMAPYQASEKCSHLVNFEELKLKSASVNSGRCRKAKKATAYTPSQR